MSTADARPRRRTAWVEKTRANATPKSDIEIRIPTANTATSAKVAVRDALAALSPNGASNVRARRLLMANAAPMMVGTCECAAECG